MELLKRVTKTANSRGNESRIAKQDSKKFPRIVETANGKLANGEGCLYFEMKIKVCILKWKLKYVSLKLGLHILTHLVKELISVLNCSSPLYTFLSP